VLAWHRYPPGRNRFEQHLSGGRPLGFFRREQPDRAVHTIETGLGADLAPAEPGNRLGEQRATDPGDLVRRYLAENDQLRPERADQPAHLAGHPLTRPADADDLRHDLR
jgi:hypothetical protein